MWIFHCDCECRILLRKILSAHSKSPTESFYLELGILPITFIIQSRRLNYLHYILNRPDNDLLKNFFIIQNKYPVKNDWVLTVKDDLRQLGLEYLSLNQIKNLKKEAFKGLVKLKCRDLAFKYLLEEKNRKSKLSNLHCKNFKIQEYLMDEKIKIRRKKLLFKIRT